MYILHCFNIHISTSRLLETCKSHKTPSLILRILQSISITENLGTLEDTEEPLQILFLYFQLCLSISSLMIKKKNLTVSRAFPSQSTLPHRLKPVWKGYLLSSLHVYTSALFLSHRQAPIGFSAYLFFLVVKRFPIL